MAELLKCAAASLLIAVALYGLAVFISLEPDVRKWEAVSRALMVWFWLMGSIGAVGLVKLGGCAIEMMDLEAFKKHYCQPGARNEKTPQS